MKEKEESLDEENIKNIIKKDENEESKINELNNKCLKQKEYISGNQLLEYLFSFLNDNAYLNPLLCGYFNRIFNNFFNNRQAEVIIFNSLL